MKVFVTGASGFIGQAVVRELLDYGHSVLGLARSEKSAEALKKLGAEPVRGTLDDPEILKQAAIASDGVIHLAFKHEEMADYVRICDEDRKTVTLLCEALEGTNKPFVGTSGTLTVAHADLATESDLADLTNPFSSGRAKNDFVILGFANKGVRSTVIRLAPTNHGEGDHGFIYMMAAKAKERGVSAYFDKGENHWPAVHRNDTAKLYRLVLENGKAGSYYHAVAEQGVTLKEIAEALGQQLGVPAASKTAEETSAHFGFLSFAIMADNIVSSEKTRKELGWTPVEKSLLDDIKAGVYRLD
ncbi:unnamed protein product [Clonostachys rosea]|uniref:NAD-dependent epimerase/dehydratase domain-containing protein n=1 Tax=Bionectria ochroleuca TaxID=29856 RepID=A0ABY6UB10_BIOOC|nr:unnamed protein product [Clonostachys rosea]